MATATRQQFIQYCLRNLGAPVVEINVDEDQIEDRIDEALEYWKLYHHEGIERFYLKQQMRASRLNLQQSDAGNFTVNVIVQGQSSGATARVTTERNVEATGTEIPVRDISGTFTAGETIYVQGNPNITTTLSQTPVTVGEIDKKYIELSDWVYGVVRVLPFSGVNMSKSMFDIQYQLRLNDLYDLASTSIIYYKMVMGHLALLDLELNGKPMFRFNRMQGRIYLDVNWSTDIHPGDYVVVECYRALDPTEFTKVWSEPWLKHYGTALIKRQWGTNLKKFAGIALPGGVQLDGQALYQEALQEIRELEEELIQKSAPLNWYMG